jgi:hypothetical protein
MPSYNPSASCVRATDDPATSQHLNYEARRMEDKLDKMLGFYYWRTYWATSLWSNIATPINLSITIFTSLMATHSSSNAGLISDEMNMKINLATFFISIINTFFTPQKQFNTLNEYLSKWSEYGNLFEKIIYSEEDVLTKTNSYIELLDQVNELHKDQFSKHRNFITDLLHGFIRVVFMKSNDRWMRDGNFDFYKKIKEAGIELGFVLQKKENVGETSTQTTPPSSTQTSFAPPPPSSSKKQPEVAIEMTRIKK